MASKFSIIGVVRDHYKTLVDQRDESNRPMPADYATLLGLPMLGGAVAWIFELKVGNVGSFVSGVAVFTGLLFALVIYVFQLRIQFAGDDRVPRDGKLADLLDQLFANLNYAVVIGITTAITGVAASSVAGDGVRAAVPFSAALIALGIHLVLVVLMCIKRTRSAYGQLVGLPRQQPRR